MLQERKRKRFGYLSFGIYENDLPTFRNRLEQLIVPTFPPPRGFESNGIWFRDEEGKMVEVAVKAKSSPRKNPFSVRCPHQPEYLEPHYAAARRSQGRGG